MLYNNGQIAKSDYPFNPYSKESDKARMLLHQYECLNPGDKRRGSKPLSKILSVLRNISNSTATYVKSLR